ncbi:MAG: hypothetical protein ACREI3_12185 [Nitrospirales bacterium]
MKPTPMAVGMTSIVLILLLGVLPLHAQTFVSGSTGALGALEPSSNVTVTLPADGILHYTTVTIPTGVTVTFERNAANTPVTLLATGDVVITGVVNVDGTAGTGQGTPVVHPGGLGGPGGFQGGQSGARGTTNTLPSAGQGPGGGAGSPNTSTAASSGTYGTPATFVSLIPLFGGSGGGGFPGTNNASGLSGGGGGGAIALASSTKITVNGTIFARGGAGGNQYTGGGSGGAIRLVAPEIVGTGTLNISGGGGGGPGRVRLEAFRMNFAGTVQPTSQYPSISTTCGPVTAASTPALADLPTLRITAIAGEPTPATTGGTYSTADLTLPPETTNPVTVEVTGTNIPVGTTFKLKHIPQFAAADATLTATSTGTFATSTATFNVTLPEGEVSLLNAFSDFTLP